MIESRQEEEEGRRGEAGKRGVSYCGWARGSVDKSKRQEVTVSYFGVFSYIKSSQDRERE